MAYKAESSNTKKRKRRNLRNLLWSIGLLFLLIASGFLLYWAYNSDSDMVRSLFGYESLTQPTTPPTRTPTVSPTPTPSPTPQPVNGTIIIDPGHGGSDVGCEAEDGTKEKDVTLQIAEALRDKLEDMEYAVFLTREDDHYVSQSERAKLVTDKSADLLISLHINSYSDTSVQGMEVLYAEDDNAKLLSKLILNDLIKQTGSVDRGVKEDTSIWLLTNAEAPSCCILMGFMTNDTDRTNLLNFVFRTEIVDGIAKGIDLYINRK